MIITLNKVTKVIWAGKSIVLRSCCLSNNLNILLFAYVFIVTNHCFFMYDIWINGTNVNGYVSFMVQNLYSAYNTKGYSEDNYNQETRDNNYRNKSLTDTNKWYEIC
jgi:hypothetical protein